MEPIISFKNYTFKYSAGAEPVLKDISLDIFPGEKILITGVAGSGKSTLAGCINGLISSEKAVEIAGELFVDGKNVKTLDAVQLSRIVGTVLQDIDMQFVGATIGEDIAFALENDCVAPADMKATVHRAAALVNADALLERAPSELSDGQRRRVAIAGLIVDETKIVIFDAPLTGLDPIAARHSVTLINSIAQHTKSTLIIIEPRIEDVLYRDLDRIILMDKGCIISDMSPDEMLCTDVLAEHGLREPLYLAALKYAGVSLTPEKCPRRFDTLALSMSDKIKVSKWFHDDNIIKGELKREVLLEVKNVSFGYDGEALLNDVSFCVNRGDMVAVTGRNGAGKSTLAKLICGFEILDAGYIRLDGQSLLNMTIRERAQKIGFVPQNPNILLSQETAFDELAFSLHLQGRDEGEIIERADDMLKICGLYDLRKAPVSSLSYSEKRRLSLASVLVLTPPILIIDEPAAGFDLNQYFDIMDYLLKLNDEGTTIILLTTDLELMLEYASRVIILSNGTLAADETPAQLLCDKEHLKQASLKETSLYTLANACYITPPEDLCTRLIRVERQVRDYVEE